MKCPMCGGDGGWYETHAEYIQEYYECGACEESGKVSLWWMITFWFWNTVPVWYIEWLYDVTHREEE